MQLILKHDRATSFLILLAVLNVTGFAQVENNRPTTPESTAPTLETVTAKLKAIEESKDIEDSLKAKLLDLYRLSQSRLTDTKQHTANAAAFSKAIETGPATVKSINDQLDKPQADPLKTLAIPSKATSKEIQGVLANEQAALAAIKTQLADLDKRLQEQQSRPTEARQQMTDAKQKLVEIDNDLKAPPPSGESQMLTEARRTALLSRQLARTNEIAMLEKELLSHDIRLQLLTAERRVATREQTSIEARIKTVEQLFQEKLVEEVGQARLDAERALAGDVGKIPAIKVLAQRVIDIGDQVSTLAPTTAAAKSDSQRLTAQLDQISKDFEYARTTIGEVGLTEALGVLLRDQRRNLPVLKTSRKSRAEQSEKISDIRLSLLKIDEKLRELSDQDGQLTQIMETVNVPESEADRVERTVRTLLKHEQDVQTKLAGAYRGYLAELDNVQRKQTQLEEKVESFASFLDDRLLWIRSSSAITTQTAMDVPHAFGWMASPRNWSNAGSVFVSDVARMPVPAVLVAVVIGILTVWRRRLFIRLDVFGGLVGLPYADRFSLTAKALLITLLLALPIPVLLGYVGWRLQQTPNTSEFTSAVAIALPMIAWLYLTMKFVHLLCRSKGTAEVHFHWDTGAVATFRKHLRWLIPTLTVFAFVTAVMEEQTNNAYRDSLGRLTFIIQMTAITVFAAWVLHPRKGIPRNLIASHPESWAAHLQYIWYPLSVMAPVAMIILAITGYYYTAVQLSERLAAMVWMVVAALVLYAVIARWLITTQQRLATERMRREREAEVEAQKAAADAAHSPAGEGAPASLASVTNVKDHAIDFETIEKQTRRIVRTLIGWSVVVATWLIWSDVLPALTLLDDVKLWDYTVVSDGQEKFIPVTLTHLALAIVLIIITFVAAKNIPGVIEIALLRHLPFDAGSRYAISTIGQYIIAGVGIVAAFRTIGIGWSSIQWLVAALGVGLGFGLQEIFANFISGIILLFERPIRVGDVVTIGDVTGVVSRIRIRATTITNWERKELIVPNKEFITGRLLNWTLSDTVNRIQIVVGVAYGSDTQKARDLLLQVADQHPLVLKEPPSVATFDGFGDSTLNMTLRAYIPSLDDRLKAIDELHRAIDETFKQHNIEIAFPQRDIHVRSHYGSDAVKSAKDEPHQQAAFAEDELFGS